MKNILKTILLILIPLIGVFILSYPGMWKYRIELILDKKILRDSDWSVSIGGLQGHLLKKVTGNDVVISNKSGATITIPEIDMEFDILKSLFGKIDLKELDINNIYFSPSTQPDTANGHFSLSDLDYREFPISIDKFHLVGALEIDMNDNVQLIDFDVLGALLPGSDGLKIPLDSVFVNHRETDNSIHFHKTNLTLNDQMVLLDPIAGAIGDVGIEGMMLYSEGEKQNLEGAITLKNIIIPDKIFEQTPLHPKFSIIDAKIFFNTDFKNYSGLTTVSNELGLNMSGDFNISRLSNRWLAQQIVLYGEDARLMIHGTIEDSGRLSTNLSLTRLNLSQWLNRQPITDFSGNVSIEALAEEGRIEAITMDFAVRESQLFEKDTISVSGGIEYANDLLNISDSVSVVIGNSWLTTSGLLNFASDSLMFDVKMNNANVFLINNFWADSIESGTLSGDIIASGSVTNPQITGHLVGRNIQYRDFNLEEIEMTGQVYTKKVSDGYARIKLGQGNWRDVEFENGLIDLTLNLDNLNFENVSIANNDDYLKGSGTFSFEKKIIVDQINTKYKGHYFVNVTPIEISFADTLTLEPFEAHFDDGVLKGHLKRKTNINGVVDFSNIEAEILHPYIKQVRQRFTGTMYGEINFTESNNFQNYNVDMTVKNGAFAKQPFNELKVLFDYNNQILNINKITLFEDNEGKFNVTGKIPFGKAKKTESIALSSQFNNIQVSSIMQFLPEWFDIDGQISGNLDISGMTNSMESKFDVICNDTKFDRIDLGLVQGSGFYNGMTLHFSSYSSENNKDIFKGYGYLPIDLNIDSETFGSFQGGDSLFIFVNGKSENVNFITNYFDEVDYAPGKYDLLLELSGIWDNIIRNGKMKVNDATIFTPYLDDPVEGLHGTAHIENNQLIIDDLNGRMYQPSRKSTKLGKDNLTISGGMDMTSFFDPYIKINTIGENIYFRSLIYEIEGFTDANVSVTGRDTIVIAGTISPIDMEMFMSFTTTELGALPVDEGSTIIHYKLEFPLKDKFKLTNNQMDAILIGNVSINQFGERDMDFGGEVRIEEGKFYYYGDVFTITDGYLAFDEQGFHPYLDMTAFTEINGEQITITIVGPIDIPLLSFESESNFSQSDILELLTWRKRIEGDDLSTTSFGNQAGDFLWSWFGNQLDKNLLEYSGLDRLDILDNIELTGTSGLLTTEKDFSISKPISENISLNYAYRNSFTLENPYHALGLEYRVNRYLSLVGNIDRTGNMHVKYRLRYAY